MGKYTYDLYQILWDDRRVGQPIVMAPVEKVVGFISLVVIGVPAAYVFLRNAIAKRHWIARWVVWFTVAITTSLLSIKGIVLMGFRGWWVQYVGHAIGITCVCFLIAPLTLQDWKRLRKRDIPKDLRRKVILRHERLKRRSYDSTREHIDHVYPFSKGGGHTLDNLHIIPKEANQLKRDTEPTAMDWFRADIAKAKHFIVQLLG